MRKLDISNYDVEGTPYSVRDSVAALLFHPELKLNARQALERDDLAHKVLKAEGDTVLLEDAEYTSLRAGIDKVTGFTRADVPFIRRVLDAPEVRVKEA